MHSIAGCVNLKDQFASLRDAAVAAKTGFEKKGKVYEAGIETARIEMIDSLVPFVSPSKRASRERWNQFAKLIEQSVTIPYAQFIPIHTIGLTGILLNIDA
jgi:hypothetical protein